MSHKRRMSDPHEDGCRCPDCSYMRLIEYVEKHKHDQPLTPVPGLNREKTP